MRLQRIEADDPNYGEWHNETEDNWGTWYRQNFYLIFCPHNPSDYDHNIEYSVYLPGWWDYIHASLAH